MPTKEPTEIEEQTRNWQKIWLDILQKEMTKSYDKKCSGTWE